MEIGKQIFYIQVKFLKAMGNIFVHPSKETIWQRIVQCALFFSLMSAQYPMFDYLIYHKDNMELVTGCISIILTNILSGIKFLTFLVNKAMFLEIMDELKLMWQNSDESSSNYIKLSNMSANRGVNFYLYSVISTAGSFVVVPLGKMAWAKIFNLPFVRELPMAMRFAFDSQQSPGYECAFIYIICVIILVITYTVAIDGLFIAFVIHLRSHLQLLQKYIEDNTFTANENAINFDICSYVKYHSKILSLANKVCQIFKPIVFVQISITSLHLCVLIYKLLTTINNGIMSVAYVTFSVSILSQLFIYCYGGEMLKTESSMVGFSVQVSKYYNLTPKHQKMLCLILMRSQKQIIVKAGFCVASFESFMTILKGAISYITLIQSIDH